MPEEWRKILGVCDFYEVSNMGNVRSNNYLGHGITKKLKLAKDKKGYLRVCLYDSSNHRRTYKVHRLVAQTFIKNENGKPEVNHINGIKDDNRIENLEWVTASENALHAFKSGLKEKTRSWCHEMGKKQAPHLQKYIDQKKKPIEAVRISDGEKYLFPSECECGKQLSLHQALISKVLKGERKSTGGYRFFFVQKEGET